MFRFRLCKAMVPACARVLDAVQTLSLKVIYFFGVHLNRTSRSMEGRRNEKNSVGETSTVVVE